MKVCCSKQSSIVKDGERKRASHTEFVNTNVLQVFPGDACYLIYTAEAFSDEVVQVDFKTQHAQPFLHAHLLNTTALLQSTALLPWKGKKQRLINIQIAFSTMV